MIKKLSLQISGNVNVKKTIFVEMGKYCLDLSKLVFGGVILTAIMDSALNRTFLILSGTFAVMIFIVIGVLVMYLTSSKNETI